MSEDLKPVAQQEQPVAVSEEINENVNNPVSEEAQPMEEPVAEEPAVEEPVAEEPAAEGPEAESAEEAKADGEETAEEKEIEVGDLSGKGLKELSDLFQSLLEKANVQQLYKYADSIKAAFYKTLNKEKAESGIEFPAKEEQPSADGAEAPSNNPFEEIEKGFKDLFSKYKGIRAAYMQELDKKKDENLVAKKALIEELKSLVDEQADLSKIYPAFRDIQARWRAIGAVPQANAKDIYETYQHYVEKFYDYVKINREFRDLDFKKNLEAKEKLCEKAEALAQDENAVSAFRKLQKLHEEWKELGPVDKEHRESIWERFKVATSVINKKHQEYFESQKDVQKANLEAKTALCEKIEALIQTEIKDSSEWNNISKEIENIQKEWKKIGFASKKENQKIYDRFRASCDKFYATKREFYSDFKSQMQENMDKKIALCEQAEAVMNSEDWKGTSEILVDLQKKWKEIGPISRKKSDQVWKRFRAACDTFFDRRDKHFGGIGTEQGDNLAKKLAVIEEIKNYDPSDNHDENVAALKEFQSRWAAIGFVPFKEKEKVQNAYNEAVEAKFADCRAEASERISRFRNRYGDRRAKQAPVFTERDRLVQKFVKMEQDIATWENNMGFFAKSKNADALLADLNEKIGKAKEELAELEQKIKSFDKQEEE